MSTATQRTASKWMGSREGRAAAAELTAVAALCEHGAWLKSLEVQEDAERQAKEHGACHQLQEVVVNVCKVDDAVVLQSGGERHGDDKAAKP